MDTTSFVAKSTILFFIFENNHNLMNSSDGAENEVLAGEGKLTL